jgi:hypothetical protein
MGRLSSQERFWKDRVHDKTLPSEEQKKAAEELERIKRRHARNKRKIRSKKSASLENDPKPTWYPLDGGPYQEYLESLAAWEKRHPEGYEKPVRPMPPVVKTIAPKSAPVIVSPPTAVAPKPVVPPPKPRPVARVCVREPKEGTSGFFYKEVFWNLPPDERSAKMYRVNRDAGLKSEFDEICATMRAPREVLSPLSESEKAKTFSPPVVREHSEVFATGQIQTVDEARAPFQPTMANAKDAGISIAPDRRGWLPDTPAKGLTPSR